ncbi:MAG: hypothetical protein IJJ26_11150, partial [Victivallales bacterium]|nr:hypothetical protein [Victivallales bacterium]
MEHFLHICKTHWERTVFCVAVLLSLVLLGIYSTFSTDVETQVAHSSVTMNVEHVLGENAMAFLHPEELPLMVRNPFQAPLAPPKPKPQPPPKPKPQSKPKPKPQPKPQP